jgi:hypothetical protein
MYKYNIEPERELDMHSRRVMELGSCSRRALTPPTNVI